VEAELPISRRRGWRIATARMAPDRTREWIVSPASFASAYLGSAIAAAVARLLGRAGVIRAIVMVPGLAAGLALGLARDPMTVLARSCRRSRLSAAPRRC
jgi:hypothetical protein